MFDYITSIRLDEEHESATGKAFVGSEAFLDHFPGAPLMPGSLLIEIAAQLSGLLAEEVYQARFGEQRWAFLGMARSAKFLYPVILPAALDIRTKVHRIELSDITMHSTILAGGIATFRGELVIMMRKGLAEWAAAIEGRHQRLAKWRTGDE